MHSDRTFRKIIAGCDGRPSGRDALALAGLLGELGDADVIAVGVYPDPMLPFPSHAALRDGCERTLRGDRDMVAPAARTQSVPALSPAAALRHAVEREHADLLVLGSDQAAERGQVRPGRHARQLLHGSPSAIALAPRGYASSPAQLRRVVAGFDGSPESAGALARARALAAAAGARLRVVTAVDPLPPLVGFEAMVYLPDDWERIADGERRDAREALDEVLAGATGVDSEVVDGDAGAVLGEASRNADLLVIGSRHWGPLARLVLGSSADYLVRNAHCPVLITPRGHAEAARPSRRGETANAT